MRKFLTTIAAFVILAGASAHSAKVTEVSLGYSNDFTVAAIKIEGQVRFTHQTEVAKNGKSFRIIVDILAATHELGAKNFEDIPECRIKSIRTSQYSVSPEQIVRIVFDMRGETAYRIDSDKNSVGVFMYDKDATPFASWSSTSVAAIEPQPVPQEVVEKTIPKSEPKSESGPKDAASIIASINRALDEDRMSSLEAKPSVEKDKPGPSTKPVKRTKVEVVTPSQMEEELGPFFVTTPREKDGKKETSKSSVEPKGTESVQPVAKEGKPSKKSTATPETKVKDKASGKTSPMPTVKKAETKKLGTKVKPGEDKKQPAKSIKSKSAKKKSAPKKTALPASPSQTESKKLAKKQSKPDSRSTARFRRSPVSSRRIKGTLVAEFPKRLVIKYKGRRYRDPFETLINESKVSNNPIERRVPNVEGLKLVGILETIEEGNRALFEDKEGYGYILKSGDKVRKGYVLRVGKDRVYFQIFEYGWSRTVALHMETY